MTRLIAGFFLGVIVTLILVYAFDENDLDLQPRPNGHSAPLEEESKAQPASPVNRNTDEAEEKNANSVASASVEAVSNDSPSDMQTQSTAVPQPDGRTLDSAQKPSAATSNDQYPPEIAEMIENRVNKELQARYESDEREESWATYMEGQLAAYFAQKPSLAQFYISLIDCRTSVCSIHVLGYGPDALTQWNTATADLVSQQWFEFNNMSMNRRNPEPDVLAIVLILTKKPL